LSDVERKSSSIEEELELNLERNWCNFCRNNSRTIEGDWRLQIELFESQELSFQSNKAID
jgi:hypothetical protein